MTDFYNREWLRKYQVNDVKTVAEFLARYYKKDRYTGRGEEYAAGLLASYQDDFNTLGVCWASHHDNVTGEIVAFFNEDFKEVLQ